MKILIYTFLLFCSFPVISQSLFLEDLKPISFSTSMGIAEKDISTSSIYYKDKYLSIYALDGPDKYARHKGILLQQRNQYYYSQLVRPGRILDVDYIKKEKYPFDILKIEWQYNHGIATNGFTQKYLSFLAYTNSTIKYLCSFQVLGDSVGGSSIGDYEFFENNNQLIIYTYNYANVISSETYSFNIFNLTNIFNGKNKETNYILEYTIYNEPTKGFFKINVDSVNLRYFPSIESSVKKVLNNEYKFLPVKIYPIQQSINGELGFWVKIKLNSEFVDPMDNGQGWVWSKYITNDHPDPNPK